MKFKEINLQGKLQHLLMPKLVFFQPLIFHKIKFVCSLDILTLVCYILFSRTSFHLKVGVDKFKAIDSDGTVVELPGLLADLENYVTMQVFLLDLKLSRHQLLKREPA